MISLCSFVKNEAHCIEHMLRSVKDYVNEIIIVDTGSEDNTIEICKSYNARVYQIGFSDFGKIRTITAHLARKPWVLMLDADETIELPQSNLDSNSLYRLMLCKEADAFAFPRKRWLDLNMTRQTELEAYPDLQVRFFKNNTNYIWKRELHEYFHGCTVKEILTDGPIIHHFHDVFHSPESLKIRYQLYQRLAKQAGVTIEGGKII